MVSYAFFSPLKPAVVTLLIFSSWYSALAILLQLKSCIRNRITEITTLKKSLCECSLLPPHLLIFKWSAVQACKDFLVAQLREQWGTRTSLALLWIKKTCGTAPSVSIQQGTVAYACLKCMNTLTDVNWSTWSLWVKHMPKCFSGLEILPFLCKSVCKYLQAGMLVF